MLRVWNSHSQLYCQHNDVMLWSLSVPSLEAMDDSKSTGTWQQDETGFTCESNVFICNIRVKKVESGIGTLEYTFSFKESLNIKVLSFSLQILGTSLHYATTRFTWSYLDDFTVIDSLTPGYIQTQFEEHVLALYIDQHAAVSLSSSGQAELIVDHHNLHPRVSHRLNTPSDRGAYCTDIHIQRKLVGKVTILYTLGEAKSPLLPLLWRYPHGTSACFVFTDHADWDKTDLLNELYQGDGGFRHTNIKTTKSVFFRALGYESPEKSFQPDGLDNPQFRFFADRLYDMGHEICPHSIVPRPKLNEPIVPSTLTEQALKLFERSFKSGTWIDHGVLQGQPANYSQRGWEKGTEWYLVDALKAHGFNSIWSYKDQLRYPLRNLNQLSARDSASTYVRHALQNVHHPSRMLNYAKIAIDMSVAESDRKRIAKSVSLAKAIFTKDYRFAAKLKRAVQFVLGLGELVPVGFRIGRNQDSQISFPPLHLEEGLTLGQTNASDILMFSTSLDNNIGQVVNNLDQLIIERGIHISHTYFGNMQSHVEPVVIPTAQGWRVSKPFASLLEILDGHISDGSLWNPTMKQCSDWFLARALIRIDVTGIRSIRLVNTGNRYIPGIFLQFLQKGTIVVNRSKKQTGETMRSLDLAPYEDIEITWGEASEKS